MFLAVDLESSDLLKRDLPLDDSSQPWIVSLAAVLCEDDGAERDFFYTRIRADGRTIKAGAQQVHGIGTRDAARSGVSEIAALGMLVGFASQATRLVAHNVEFGRDVIVSTLLRLKKDARMLTRPGLELCCTMRTAAPICKIPGAGQDGQHKWPSLQEAAKILLGVDVQSATHSAWEGCVTVKQLYLELMKLNAREAAA